MPANGSHGFFKPRLRGPLVNPPEGHKQFRWISVTASRAIAGSNQIDFGRVKPWTSEHSHPESNLVEEEERDRSRRSVFIAFVGIPKQDCDDEESQALASSRNKHQTTSAPSFYKWHRDARENELRDRVDGCEESCHLV
jgi:hypothetical protein